jgi:hypothetical protein
MLPLHRLERFPSIPDQRRAERRRTIVALPRNPLPLPQAVADDECRPAALAVGKPIEEALRPLEKRVDVGEFLSKRIVLTYEVKI